MWNKLSSLTFINMLAAFPWSLLSPAAIMVTAEPMTRVSLSASDLDGGDYDNERQLTFGMVSGDSTFFDPVKAGWEAECTNRNVTCLYLPVNYTYYFEEQADDYVHPCIPLMLDLIEMGVDGISAACSFDDLTPWQMAHDAGIPLVAFDSKPPEEFPIPLEGYVGTDQTFLGRTLARLLKQLRPEGGRFGIVHTPAFVDRVEAFRDELTKENEREDRAHWYEVDLPIQSYDIPNDIDQFAWYMEFLAETNPTAMIFMYQTPMRGDNYTQFIDKHRHRNITYIGTDGSDYQLEYLSRRYVDGLVGQLPYDMGAFSVDILLKAALKEKKPIDVQTERQHSNHEEVVLDIPELQLIPTNLVAYNLIPIELPELIVDQNLLKSKVIAGYLCFGIVTVSCALCCGWTIVNRNGVVVKASQPAFLVMTLFGIFLMASALIPLSFDDDGNPEIATESFKRGICMSIPWLLFTGFTCTFAALFSKTWRVNKFFHSKSQFGRIKISEFDVLVPFVVLLSLNIIILICWTAIDPLTYEREFLLGLDYWNREIASVGRCRSDHPAAYLVPLACGKEILLACGKSVDMLKLCIFLILFFV
jgi:ABC-type sugar transport system substrate-binding protein